MHSTGASSLNRVWDGLGIYIYICHMYICDHPKPYLYSTAAFARVLGALWASVADLRGAVPVVAVGARLVALQRFPEV